MKPISPSHPITIESAGSRVIVRADGQVLADSNDALKLREAQYPAVLYIPRADAKLSLFERSSHNTHCPYKGDASYFTLTGGEKPIPNVAWSYETPYEQVSQIAGHLAFYPDKVEVEAPVERTGEGPQ